MFFLGAAAFFLVRWLVTELRSLLITLLVSLFLSFAIEPAVNRLTARGWRRGTATWVVFLAVTVVSLAFVAAIATVLVRQLTNFVDPPPTTSKTSKTGSTTASTPASTPTSSSTNSPTPKDPCATTATGSPRTPSGSASASSAASSRSSPSPCSPGTWSPTAPACAEPSSPGFPPTAKTRYYAPGNSPSTTGGYIYSRALLAAISALTSWIFLSIIGVPYPVPLALWVGVVSQFVPVIGTYLAGAMAVLVQGP